jgi:hypothetical protein
MKKLLLLVALAGLLPSIAQAQVSLGLRLGYSKATGNVGGDTSMDDWVGSQVPIQADVLLRVAPKLSVGAYASYGFGSGGGHVSAICDQSGVTCSLGVLRLGVQGVYEFTPGSVAPWIGAGIGWEWNSLHAKDSSGSVGITYGGFEALNLQGGFDWKLSPSFSLGPFLMVSVGWYERVNLTNGGFGVSSTVGDNSFHGWNQIGFRGRFDL